MGNLRYYSEKKAWTDSTDLEFFDFIPREGPTGGRVVIDGFWLRADTSQTVTTAVVQGEDFARWFGRIIVETRDGTKRWNLPGDSSRIMSYLLCGAEKVPELIDGVVGAATLANVAIYIPMTKPLVHTPEDFALPADEFGKVIISGMASTDLNIGTSVVTVPVCTYYIIVDAHEEHDLQFHCTDVVKQDDLTSTTEAVINISGKLHDLVLHARGASGGASLANFTDIRIDEPQGLMPTSKKTELLTEYRWKRGVANNLNSTIGGEIRSDPFATNQASAVFVSDKRISCFEGPTIDRMKLNLTNTVASLRAITRTIKPRSVATANAVAAAYGVASVEQLSVKTAKKTQRSLSQWRGRERWVPLKAPLSKR